MRYLCASFALGIGLLALLPDSAQACRRRGAVSYGYAPAYGYGQPMYSAYYPSGAYYPPQGYALGTPDPYRSFYPPSPMPAPATTVVAVSLTDDKFDPTPLTIQPGTQVRWTNNGAHKHTVTSTGTWDSGDILPGQSFTATFTQSGTFEYFCKYHKDMKGTISVKSMPAPATTTVSVSMTDDKFTPTALTIEMGTTVRWMNDGKHKHTVTSTGTWDSGDLAPGEFFTATFTQPGTFEYFCKHHADMKGKITVKEKK